MSFGSRARAAMAAYGPALCRHRPPRIAARPNGACPTHVEGLDRFACDLRRGVRRPRRVRQAAVGILRAVRRQGSRRCSSVRSRTSATPASLVILDVKRGDIGVDRSRVRRGLPRRGRSDGGRRHHGQPLSRLRIAEPVLRRRREERRRRVRAGPDLQQGGAGGAARHATETRPSPAASSRSSPPSTPAPSRWVRSARSSARRSATPLRIWRSTVRCSCPGSARRAARWPTSTGSSATSSPMSSPRRRGACSSQGPDVEALRDSVARVNAELVGS